jgi:hypothetical protein
VHKFILPIEIQTQHRAANRNNPINVSSTADTSRIGHGKTTPSFLRNAGNDCTRPPDTATRSHTGSADKRREHSALALATKSNAD